MTLPQTNVLQEKGRKFLTFIRTMRLLWQAAPLSLGVLSGIALLQGLMPVFTIYLTKLVVDAAVALAGGGQGALPLWQLISLWCVSLLAGTGITPWRTLIVQNLHDRFDAYLNRMLLDKANSLPDLGHYENPQFYDDVQFLRSQVRFRPLNFILSSNNLAPLLIRLVALVVLLGSLVWWLPLLMLVALVPELIISLKMERFLFWGKMRKNNQVREMSYVTSVVLDHSFAKEIRLFKLGGFLVDRYQRLFDDFYETMRQLRWQQATHPIPFVLLNTVGNLVAFTWVLYRAAAGQLSAGDVVLFLGALVDLRSSLNETTIYTVALDEILLFFGKFFDFLKLEPTTPLAPSPKPIPQPLQDIRFDNISFYYPDGRMALKNVSFSIRAGERIAVVGENGAGKSTLVKLLARFFDPSEGRILLDGVDLRELDLDAWRQQLGAVFQDFGKYHLSVRENVALGSLDALEDEARLLKALDDAGLAETISVLEEGIHTRLGKQFDGTELSGGQWQKLAIARALVRNANILILDEPTASLDPRAEHAIYERFASLATGKTALLITHRLASVQMADRILVLKDGGLIEQGTHVELMRLGGEYATLFRIQAERYQQVEVRV